MIRAAHVFLLLVLLLAGCASGDPSPYHSGKLLVARPGMSPNLFSHSIVLLMNHDEQGAFGFILNRPGGEAKLADLLRDLDQKLPDPMPANPSLGMYLGGPVEIGTLYLLHSADLPSRDTITAAGRYVLSKPLETMGRMAESGQSPKHAILLLGYSGWGAGQLESEIERGDWEIIDPSDDLVFSGQAGEAWQRAWDRRAVGL
ncbi:MAG: YqgE/AlgH family protein [Alphaproteobacteria bacterium]|nr:YqgE/AlgH family protein [Alphaproteobacteria bacterium]